MFFNRISTLGYAASVCIGLALLCEAQAGITCYSKLSYSSNFVTAVQKTLSAAGFDPGTADGKWGNKTGRALEAFQRAKRLPARGDINGATLQALFGPGASPETYGLTKNPHLPPNDFSDNCR